MLEMTNWSIRQPWAASAPASTAEDTAAVSPAMTTIYFPEQIERDSTSRTWPALSMVSATRNPAATLDSSMRPMDFSSIIQSVVAVTASTFEHDLLVGNLTDQGGDGCVKHGAQGISSR